MSYDLWVWAGPAYTGVAVREALKRFDEDGDLDVFDRSDLLMQFHGELLETFSPVRGTSEIHQTVWSVPPDPSEHVLMLAITRDVVRRVAPVVVARAHELRLLTYDPQTDTVYVPADARDDVLVDAVRTPRSAR